MLEKIEKAVLRFPLTSFPKPGHFATHRTAHKVMRRLTRMDADARWAAVPGIAINAMMG
jgi:hypothetical protein